MGWLQSELRPHLKHCDSDALAEWHSWLEHCPVCQTVVDSVPGQGSYLGCKFDSLFRAHTGSIGLMSLPHINVFSLSPPFSKINKCTLG